MHDASNELPDKARNAGFARISAVLAALEHPHAPVWLDVGARTAQEAADALGVSLGQIAKSVVFRRKGDDAAVLVIASGDKRVDESKLKAFTGALGRADADYVKARTGFAIGGVSPLGFSPQQGQGPQVFIDRELFRFEVIWAAAGHPNGVFKMTPSELQKLTLAPVIDVVQQCESVKSPCNKVCRMNESTGWCEGCARSMEEIMVWGSADADTQRAILARLPQRLQRLRELGIGLLQS